MSMPTPRGACTTCGKTWTSRGMSRHIAACRGQGRHLHLRFADASSPLWWLHLAVAPTATLRDVDQFLRAIWLECCGHLSAFTIGHVRYDALPDLDDWGPPSGSMDTGMNSVLSEGVKFIHEYDFGSTTRLAGQMIGLVRGGRSKVEVLARNGDIPWTCNCEQPATALCMHCGALVCDACMLETPECSTCECSWEECALPVLNSPRMGVCGYDGEP